MQYYYGEKNILRALDEAEFWKHHEKEHTIVIQLVTPDLEKGYIDKLNEFGKSFDYAHGIIVQLIESNIRSKENINEQTRERMLEWIEYCILQSKKFIELLTYMLKSSGAVEKNTSSQTVINHIIRESQYFIGIDQLILS